MEKDTIQTLTRNFESSVHTTSDGLEFWLARDLQKLLGYDRWENFENVIKKAKVSCDTSKQAISDHFRDVTKTIQMPKGAKKDVSDIMLTRYACYLIAQNGDPKKQEIAFAQTYFAVQTRKYEIIERRLLESERIQARKKLSEAEKELSGIIFEQTKDTRNFAFIRSKGDQALFERTTQEMKDRWGIKSAKALADFMPTILLKAKDFATEITIFNAKDKRMTTEKQLSDEHVTNNRSVRKTLISRGIVPENLPPEEDVKKVERRIQSENKKGLKRLNGKDGEKIDARALKEFRTLLGGQGAVYETGPKIVRAGSASMTGSMESSKKVSKKIILTLRNSAVNRAFLNELSLVFSKFPTGDYEVFVRIQGTLIYTPHSIEVNNDVLEKLQSMPEIEKVQV